MKEDAPVPGLIPRKRRQLEQALDVWLATWLARDDLAPSERRRLEEERERRKQLRKRETVTVGIIAAEEGMTPLQFIGVVKALRMSVPTSVLHTRLPRKAHGTVVALCESIGATHCLIADVRDEQEAARAVVREADMVIAAPREATVQTYATPGVWSVVGYARHRHLPVQVVLPNGDVN